MAKFINSPGEAPLTDDEWIRKQAAAEDGCFVGAGSPSVAPLIQIPRLSAEETAKLRPPIVASFDAMDDGVDPH